MSRDEIKQEYIPVELTDEAVQRATEALWVSGLVANPADGPDQTLVRQILTLAVGVSCGIPQTDLEAELFE